MDIAILYIATGRYTIFWKAFYESCERHFIPGYEKKYYVFTDAQDLVYHSNQNVTIIPHRHMGWPHDTLLRFRLFKSIETSLAQNAFIFFFNSNMQFLQPITAQEFLPDGIKDDGLLAVQHPSYYNQARAAFPYEDQQKQSTAYIGPDSGRYYFMGGVNGGTSAAYLQLIRTLNSNIDADLANNIIAKWHDESHLNHYLLNRNPRILSPAYGFPENRKLKLDKKIIVRDKNHYGGHDFLRGKTNRKSMRSLFRYYLKRITSAI